MSKIKNMSRKKKFGLLFILLFVIAFVAGGTGIYLYQTDSAVLGKSAPTAEEEVQDLVEKVGKLIKLPNETPTIATVSDVSQLQEQTIFKNAQNGDKVLIFADAKRAILYRPSENIVVEVGNLVINPQDETSVVTDLDEESEELPASVVVLNATTTAGYAGRIGDRLSEEFSNIEIESTGNAAGEYTSVIVVDVTGDFSELAQSIADQLEGEVDELPDDEDDQGADILVILGE